MAGLLRTQQVTGAPDLQIPHGDFEAGAELGKFPDGVEPLFRHLGELFIPLKGEIRVSVAVGPAHTAPELVQLG